MLELAGININLYSAHSSRSAAASYAKSKGVPLKTICATAGWSTERTFARFYDKEIEDDIPFL